MAETTAAWFQRYGEAPGTTQGKREGAGISASPPICIRRGTMSNVEKMAEAPLTEARLQEILKTGGTFYFRTTSPHERNRSRVLAIRQGLESGLAVQARFVKGPGSLKPFLEIIITPRKDDN